MINEKCPYYSYEYISSWHNDIFDHPDYSDFCSKNGEKREIITCSRCSYNKSKEKGIDINVE